MMDILLTFLDKLGPQMIQHAYEHIHITFYALLIAIGVALPLGIYLTRCPWPRVVTGIMSVIGIIQTVPSLALIAIIVLLFAMMSLPTIGFVPALVALVMYALLPIVRNTYTGIRQVDPATVEVARGMGMTSRQILLQVELPLSLPIIMAGIRIATVWTIGVACLGTFVGGGGLGDLIMIGLRSIQSDYIVAGTLPAALLAIVFDLILGRVENWLSPEQPEGKRRINAQAKLYAIVGFLLAAAAILPFLNPARLLEAKAGRPSGAVNLRVAFDAEFHNRPDGYRGLCEHYQLAFPEEPGQMDVGLMYRALADGSVDVIDGFATDGRIPAYGLFVLEDDQHFFPPYYAAPLIRAEALEKHPEVAQILSKLGGKVSDGVMQRLNYEADEKGRRAQEIAREFLVKEGLIPPDAQPGSGAAGTLRIGGKDFTEQEILGELMATLIECSSDISVTRKLNLGGTMICFNALQAGDLDLYAEYTGTGLVSILKEPVIADPDEAYAFVKKAFGEQFGLAWLAPFGLNNTYTLTMRRDHAEQLGVKTISDLADLVRAPQ